MKPEVNYTAEQVAKMVEEYTKFPNLSTVAALAALFGKTEKSVIAKLSREGVYRKQVRTNKVGEPAIRKEQLVKGISQLVGYNVESLEKASKQDLIRVINALAKLAPQADAV
jgi:hypothetical protein